LFSDARVRELMPKQESEGELDDLTYGTIFVVSGTRPSGRLELLYDAICKHLGISGHTTLYIHKGQSVILATYHLMNPLAVLDSFMVDLGDYRRREHVPGKGYYFTVQAYFRRLLAKSRVGWDKLLPGLRDLIEAMWHRYFGREWGGPKPVPFGEPIKEEEEPKDEEPEETCECYT